MFIVFNKQKIYSYLVALSTVAVLFVIGFAVTNKPVDSIQTSINVERNNIVINQIDTNEANINSQVSVNYNSNLLDQTGIGN